MKKKIQIGDHVRAKVKTVFDWQDVGIVEVIAGNVVTIRKIETGEQADFLIDQLQFLKRPDTIPPTDELVEVELMGGPEDGLRLLVHVEQFREVEKANDGFFAMSFQGHTWQAREEFTVWRTKDGLVLVRLWHMGKVMA